MTHSCRIGGGRRSRATGLQGVPESRRCHQGVVAPDGSGRQAGGGCDDARRRTARSPRQHKVERGGGHQIVEISREKAGCPSASRCGRPPKRRPLARPGAPRLDAGRADSWPRRSGDLRRLLPPAAAHTPALRPSCEAPKGIVARGRAESAKQATRAPRTKAVRIRPCRSNPTRPVSGSRGGAAGCRPALRSPGGPTRKSVVTATGGWW